MGVGLERETGALDSMGLLGAESVGHGRHRRGHGLGGIGLTLDPVPDPRMNSVHGGESCQFAVLQELGQQDTTH